MKKEELMDVEGGWLGVLRVLAGLALLAGGAHDATCGGGYGQSCAWSGGSLPSGAHPGMNFF